MIQVLFSFGPDEVLRSVAWLEGDLLMRRIHTDDGATFDRWSSSLTLGEEWQRFEALYCFFRPALLPSLGVAFELLGRHLDVLDHVPLGTLTPPQHWVRRR